MQEEKHNFYFKYILRRINYNKNFLQCTVGATGSGKSWQCLSIAEILERMQGREFQEWQICNTPLELIKLINSDRLTIGNCIVWEETGVAIDSRSALTIDNKQINYLLQTFRASNYILLMNVPYFSMIDSNARKLMHCLNEVVKIDRRTQETISKPKLLQTNPSSGKTYFKYLRVKPYGTTRLVKLSKIRIPKPSKRIIQLYELKKKQFNRALNVKIYNKLEIKEQKDNVKPLGEGHTKPLTLKQKEVYNCLKEGMLIPEIAKKTGKSINNVMVHIKLIRKKGYIIDPIKDKATIKGYSLGN